MKIWKLEKKLSRNGCLVDEIFFAKREKAIEHLRKDCNSLFHNEYQSNEIDGIDDERGHYVNLQSTGIDYKLSSVIVIK